jgi:hypothetical protein
MKNFKKFVLAIISSVLISLFTILLINFLVDPLSIFNTPTISNFNKVKPEKDKYQRLVKFHELNTLNKEDAVFIIGTSRSDNLKTKDLYKFVNKNIYNLSLNSSSPYEQYYYIKYIIENFDIDLIVLTFDFFSYNPLLKPTSDFNKERLTKDMMVEDYLKSLLSINGIKSTFLTLKANLSDKYKSNLNYDEGKFERTLQGFKKTKSLYNSSEFQNPSSIDYQLNYLKKIFTLINNNNIKYKSLIMPISCEQYKLIFNMNLESSYNRWKEELSYLTEYTDFSGCNDITMNKENFYDSSHIRSDSGKIIFSQLFNYNKDLNFGKIVNKKVKNEK